MAEPRAPPELADIPPASYDSEDSDEFRDALERQMMELEVEDADFRPPRFQSLEEAKREIERAGEEYREQEERRKSRENERDDEEEALENEEDEKEESNEEGEEDSLALEARKRREEAMTEEEREVIKIHTSHIVMPNFFINSNDSCQGHFSFFAFTLFSAKAAEFAIHVCNILMPKSCKFILV